MKLHLLPDRCGSAAENMATDFLLLQRYPTAEASAVRLRHYTWLRPSITFGFSQKYALVREALASLTSNANFDVTRRATGGGIVDHRDDWTYALVIPRGHALEALPAGQSYRLVHEALADALTRQSIPATLKLKDDDATAAVPKTTSSQTSPAAQCFQRAECFDVIRTDSNGQKIAGAAQKRTKQGLLFQGSVSRSASGGEAADWEKFYADFAKTLACLLGTEIEPVGWPDFAEAEMEGLIEQYSSPEWLEYR